MVSNIKPDNYFIDLIAENGGSPVVINATATVYLQSIALPKNASFGIELQFSSGGTIDVQVDWESGNVDLTAAQENAANGGFVVSDAVSAGITDANNHFLALSPVVSKFGRLKLTGQGSNAASTQIDKARVCISKNS